jgi:hypothetical protein
MIERLCERAFVVADQFNSVRVHLYGISALAERCLSLRQIREPLRYEYILRSAHASAGDPDAYIHRVGEIIGEIARYPAHERGGGRREFDGESVAEDELVVGGSE